MIIHNIICYNKCEHLFKRNEEAEINIIQTIYLAAITYRVQFIDNTRNFRITFSYLNNIVFIFSKTLW